MTSQSIICSSCIVTSACGQYVSGQYGVILPANVLKEKEGMNLKVYVTATEKMGPDEVSRRNGKSAIYNVTICKNTAWKILYNMCFVFFSLPILYAITTKGHKII
jgi:hypothetical protein